MLSKLTLTLLGMEPNASGQIVRCKRELGPVLSAFGVPFVCSRASEGQAETHDETENCQQQGVYADCPKISSLRINVRQDRVQLNTNLQRQVTSVDQPATKANGRIISGKILPCIRRKVGHLECLMVSRGPTK
jgi:hypothetical protein